MSRHATAISTAVMLAVTALWGFTFVAVKDAVAVYPPLAFLALRFTLAAVILGVFALRRMRSARLGLVIGALLAAGYLGQTFGLQRVPASTGGLLTGLFVVFTPVCDALFFGVRASRVTVGAIALALAGMVALTSGGGVDSSHLLGEAMLLGCAVAFAAHIAFLSRYSREHDPVALAGWQMLACSGLFLVGGLSHRDVSLPIPNAVLVPIAVTGVGASAVGFLAQTFVQRRLSAARTALLLTAEPVFAVLFGIVIAHDAVTPLKVAGALTILVALVGHEAIVARGRPPGEPAS